MKRLLWMVLLVCGEFVCVATAMEDEQQQLIVAMDRQTGVERWRTVVHSGGFPSSRQVHRKGTHANGTLASDDEHLFAAFLNANKIIASARTFDGNLAWQTELGAFDSKFGYAPSPLVFPGSAARRNVRSSCTASARSDHRIRTSDLRQQGLHNTPVNVR